MDTSQASKARAVFADAVAVIQMNPQDAGPGENAPAPACHGDVELGVRLGDEERANSLTRGGDGSAAHLDGGWLDAGQGTHDCLSVQGYELTCYVRLKIPDGRWDAPILSKHGGDDRLSYHLYGRPFGHDHSARGWEIDQQNYCIFGDEEAKGYALEFEMGVDHDPDFVRVKRQQHERRREGDPGLSDFEPPEGLANGIWRVGVPVEMIGPEQWHDLIVRFFGTLLELIVDGVVVDHEWPIGTLRTSPAPMLIGAADVGGRLIGGFCGEISHAAVWNRALADHEVTALCGGTQSVAEAERRILGPVSRRLQYWRPRGHNTWVGDTMCAFYQDRFHLFYLFDRRHHTSKWGCGAHQFAHVSSADLVHWEHHPMAVPITRQWETFGTGCPVVVDGKLQVHYGHHSTRLFPVERTVQSQLDAQFGRDGRYGPLPMESPDAQWPEADVPIGHSVATSEDGVHFTKRAELLTPSQNMWVFQVPDSNQSGLIWGEKCFLSNDLRHWELHDGHLLPTGAQTPARNTSECPCYFEWHGWHYVLMGLSGMWMSRHPLGPYWDAPLARGTAVRPRWSLYDGLVVPMVAPFRDDRRILAGFAGTPSAVDGRPLYAGDLVFRELVQHEDGTLGTKWPEEMIPRMGEPVHWALDTGKPGVERFPAGACLSSDGFFYSDLSGLPANYRLSAIVLPGRGVKAFGLTIGGQNGDGVRCELRFEPAAGHVQWGSPGRGEPAERVPEALDCRSPHARDRGGDFALDHVEGLDAAFGLVSLVVRRDPRSNVTLIDACIDRRRTMITHRCGLRGGRVSLFCWEGEVTFQQLVVRPLVE